MFLELFTYKGYTSKKSLEFESAKWQFNGITDFIIYQAF